MELLLKANLPFISLMLEYQGISLVVQNVLVDTGSASTIFAADIVSEIGIVPRLTDVLEIIQGIGGTEAVFTRNIDSLALGNHKLENFTIEIGGMDYGFEINGILGMDALIQVGAIINLREMKIEFGNNKEIV